MMHPDEPESSSPSVPGATVCPTIYVNTTEQHTGTSGKRISFCVPSSFLLSSSAAPPAEGASLLLLMQYAARLPQPGVSRGRGYVGSRLILNDESAAFQDQHAVQSTAAVQLFSVPKGFQSQGPRIQGSGNDSWSTRGRGKFSGAPGGSVRVAKATSKGTFSRNPRGHRTKAKFPHAVVTRASARSSQAQACGGAADNKQIARERGREQGGEVDKQEQSEETQAAEGASPSPPLEARRSTYFSICLNASPDELTVVSYNLRMESGCCSLDDNWKRREAALSRFLLALEDAHHPDVIILQGAFAGSTQRLLKTLVREEPMFPFQTRVVGGDAGCCKAGNEEGGCSCGSCWFCLPFPTRKKALKNGKGSPAAFVMNNGWDSVCGSYSRLRGNGGLVVISKWPVLRRHAFIFPSSAYPYSLSNMGAALVQIEKCGKVYNLLAMQLQPGAAYNDVRVAQVKEVMAWVRTGMEDAEKVEFASCDIDGAFDSSTVASTRSESSVITAERAGSTDASTQTMTGLPELESKWTSASPGGKEVHTICRGREVGLPKGILKATDPLIIGGNLNFRFGEDRAALAEALGPDGFNANLALEDASFAQPNFDTVANDTCYESQGCPKEPSQELLDYLLIHSEHAGRVARGQRTLIDPSPEKILFRSLALGCMPCSAIEVRHVSDFFPVCATFAHNAEG
ncbi:uncharacterized protein LOC34620970 [Cyclospora cayetanensis]|uniref:Uncharacterized protein LOC34620970 n=1 Tax=Cyclospora cayetanensis TaxID=88456 RepID=A0A6P6RU33_9EIME|nr:uncharacterized protein LOC34620970 [Cyclospora cayetanensis]